MIWFIAIVTALCAISVMHDEDTFSQLPNAIIASVGLICLTIIIIAK